MSKYRHLTKEERDQLKPIDVQWKRLLTDGVLVDISISKWHPHIQIKDVVYDMVGIALQDEKARKAADEHVS